VLKTQKQVLEAPPGKHPTSTPGLTLKVAAGGNRRWILRWSPERGVKRDVTIGTATSHTLAQAHSAAAAIRAGETEAKPAMLRRRTTALLTEAEARAQGVRTFQVAAEDFIERKRVAWRSPITERQFRNQLVTYAYPELGRVPVSLVTSSMVLEVVGPIWGVKAETADRVRSAIERVLQREIVLGNRAAMNPATLDTIQTLTGVSHDANTDRVPGVAAKAQGRSMPAPSLETLGAFIASVWSSPSSTGFALLFQAYTASREGMVLGATWQEIDWDAKLWRVPAERMKSGKAFDQPLSSGAMQVLTSLGPVREGILFKNKRGAQLSNMTGDMMIRRWCARTGSPVWVPHGLRSAFRGWGMATGQDFHIAELSMSHTLKDRVAMAYIDTAAAMPRRVALMEAWSAELGRWHAEAVLA
jgi:integrase